MSEFTDLLERARRQFPSSDLPIDRVRRRRDRKRRNQRIGSALIALVVAALAVGVMVRLFPSANRPAQKPTPTQTLHVPSPSPSPNGLTVRIWNHPIIVGLDGRVRRQLPSVPHGASSITLSPDGSLVVFDNNRGRIGAIDFRNGFRWWVTSYDPNRGAFRYAMAPKLSPDAQLIAYEYYTTAKGWRAESIKIVSPDGSKEWRVAQRFCSRSPVWSPDGLEIAFLSGPGCRYGAIYTANVNKHHHYRFITKGSDPVWSSDGSKIIFSRGRLSGRWIVAADGSGPITRYTPNPPTEPYGSLSPDGSMIAVAKECSGGESVDIVDVASGATRHLGCFHGIPKRQPFWLPGGDALLL